MGSAALSCSDRGIVLAHDRTQHMIIAGRAARSTSSPSRVPAFAIQSPNCAENAESGPPACSRDFRYRFDCHVISAVRARDREVAGSCHRLDPRGGSTFNSPYYILYTAVFSIEPCPTGDCGPAKMIYKMAGGGYRKHPTTYYCPTSTLEPMGCVSKSARMRAQFRARKVCGSSDALKVHALCRSESLSAARGRR